MATSSSSPVTFSTAPARAVSDARRLPGRCWVLCKRRLLWRDKLAALGANANTLVVLTAIIEGAGVGEWAHGTLPLFGEKSEKK